MDDVAAPIAVRRQIAREPTRPWRVEVRWRPPEAVGVDCDDWAAARRMLEWAGVLTWQNRIVRVRERCTDPFGHEGWR